MTAVALTPGIAAIVLFGSFFVLLVARVPVAFALGLSSLPILLVEPSGNAKIDLWCKSVPARIEISDMAIKIELGPLPEGLPEMLSVGQCTPERMQADQELLATLAQVTGWQRENGGIVLVGPTELKFRPGDH